MPRDVPSAPPRPDTARAPQPRAKYEIATFLACEQGHVHPNWRQYRTADFSAGDGAADYRERAGVRHNQQHRHQRKSPPFDIVANWDEHAPARMRGMWLFHT